MMTFDELIAEAEARRAERRAFVAVEFRPRWPRRGVRLSARRCGCLWCNFEGDAMTDRIFVTASDFAVASDGVQWILMRRVRRARGDSWDAISFVRSERNILARCAREKGADAGTVDLLTSGLPDTFDQWKAAQPARGELTPASGTEA